MLSKLTSTDSLNFTLTILRLVLGVVIFAHGAQKLLGWFGGYGYRGTMGFFTQMRIPAPLAFLAIMAEFLGGLGLIVGFLSRIAAFGIFCNMLVAVLLVHRQFGFFANWGGQQKGEGFEFHLLALAIALVIMIAGGGALSVDAAISGTATHRQISLLRNDQELALRKTVQKSSNAPLVSEVRRQSTI
jgi:putative oxidoreductase